MSHVLSASLACRLILLASLATPACDPGASSGDGAAQAPTAALGARADDGPPEDLEGAFDAAWRRAKQLDRTGVTARKRIRAWRAVHALRPDARLVNELLGRALLDGYLRGEAAEHFWSALEHTPSEMKAGEAYAELLLLYAQTLIDLGRDQEAMQLLVRMPDNAEAAAESWTVMARVLDGQGDRAGARQRVDDAITKFPGHAWRAFALRGRFLFEEQEYDAARQDFQAALRQRPDCKPALKGLADSERRSGHDQAADRWDEILTLMVDLTDDVVKGVEPAFRRPRLERLTELYPRWIAGWIELADLLEADEGRDAACALIRQLVARAPSDLGAGQRMALLEQRCGDDP